MGNRIVAVMGVTPAPFTQLRQTCPGAELTTWVVAPEARGKGVGKAMLDHLQSRYAVLTGAGITAAALPLYLGAGFTHLAHLPRFFHVADFDKAQTFATISDAARHLNARRQAQARAQAWQAQPVPASDLAPAAVSLSRFGHFRRDAARLVWRHDHHPAFLYEGCAVQDPAHGGAGTGVVLREDLVLETPILHVIDVFGSPRHLPATLAFVEDETRRRGAAFVDNSLTAGPLIAHLRARGWSSDIDDPLIEMPSLFYPVELRRPPTTSLVLWGRDMPHQLYDFGRLHITRADMDLDRPTLAWYDQHPT